MIGIVMAGGKGSRMSLPTEKLLLEYKKPIILHVIDALKESKCFSKILAITSPNSPETKNFLQKNNVDVIDSSGKGYVEDLNHLLKTLDDSVFVTSGDLPLLDGEIVQTIVNKYNSQNIWTSILVSKEFLESLKITTGFEIIFNNKLCCYSGISLINSSKINNLNNISENYVVLDDKRIGFNLNTKEDYDLLGTA